MSIAYFPGFRIVRTVKSRREDRLVSQEERRGLDLTEISSPVKSDPVKDWSNMGSLQASLVYEQARAAKTLESRVATILY